MANTYQDHAVENLAQFGWTLTADQIPDYATCVRTLNRIGDWWLGLDERTRAIVGACDVAPGLRDQGFFQEWPALFDLLSGNVFAWYADTHNDVAACLERAKNQVGEQQPYEPTEP